jgi:hypothetical protein
MVYCPKFALKSEAARHDSWLHLFSKSISLILLKFIWRIAQGTRLAQFKQIPKSNAILAGPETTENRVVFMGDSITEF